MPKAAALKVQSKKKSGCKKVAARAAVESKAKSKPRTKPAASPGQPVRARAKPERVIRVRGAKEHNLKNINVTIPRDQLVVITGLSGSGKSSLAFDTIFAEGQRKYMESLSAYARQFLDQLKKPDVEEVEGIPPTIAIEQRSASHNPRSTVATTTEIYDYLRLLYARCGVPYSWAPTKTKRDGTVSERSGKPISATSASQIVESVMKWEGGLRNVGSERRRTGGVGSERQRTEEVSSESRPTEEVSSESRPTEEVGSEIRRTEEVGSEIRRTKMMILAPIVRGKKGFHRDVLEDLHRHGWQRARVNGKIVSIREVLMETGENPLGLGRYVKHTVEAVVDRIVLKDDARQRVAESIEAALRLGDGAVIVSVNDPDDKDLWTDTSFSEKFADPERPEYALEEISPRLFSFNSPFGACSKCHGLGSILEFDEDLVVPDMDKPMLRGAIAPWKKNGPGGMVYPKKLRWFCKAYGVLQTDTIGSLDAKTYAALIYGDAARGKAGAKVGKGVNGAWPGVLTMLHDWFHKTESTWVKDHLHLYQSSHVCPDCRGDRLRIEALHVQLTSEHTADTGVAFSDAVIGRPEADGTMLNITELSRLTITDALAFVEGVALSKEHAHIAQPILREVGNRLRFLQSVGLEYLSLSRRTATLSGGEAQRIRLATQVGSGLVGACYVLDEPTIGLHQRDNARLIKTLRHLTDIGNTVIVVEHDEEMIQSADHVLDIGPGPGVHGGEVVAQGSIAEICAEPRSLTGDYLARRRSIPIPAKRRSVAEKRAIVVKGARQNNLTGIDVAFPIGGFICVTGVSGSGKSTLVNDILLKSAKRHILGTRDKPGEHGRVTGLSKIDRVIEVDQSPIGRTPRSNPATYTGFFGDIRNVFTQTKESKIRGYKPGRFSFNVVSTSGGGRCEACQGQGLKKIEMHFLPDVYVECEVCEGKRYSRETLEVLYRGKNIADVLAMTVEDACTFFEHHPKILRFVTCLRDVGLGYIQLGQASTTLSGGEAQRIKLAAELGKGGGTKNDPRSYARGSGNTLYILDEPTTGLHFEDVAKLIEVLNRLADGGNTLVIIEHNLDVIKCADWVIDLGPEGGDGGGRIVAAGTPEALAKKKGTYTGTYLRDVLRAG